MNEFVAEWKYQALDLQKLALRCDVQWKIWPNIAGVLIFRSNGRYTGLNRPQMVQCYSALRWPVDSTKF